MKYQRKKKLKKSLKKKKLKLQYKENETYDGGAYVEDS